MVLARSVFNIDGSFPSPLHSLFLVSERGDVNRMRAVPVETSSENFSSQASSLLDALASSRLAVCSFTPTFSAEFGHKGRLLNNLPVYH